MKKGQAALEFLMTYGWAILVVLVVIGALAYFGVLNPNILVPEKCTLQTGFACQDFVLDSDGLIISLENGLGTGVYITNMSINATDGDASCYAAYKASDGKIKMKTPDGENISINDTEHSMLNGKGMTINVRNGTNCNFTDIGRKTKLDVSIEYYKMESSPDFTKTIPGEILASIEE